MRGENIQILQKAGHHWPVSETLNAGYVASGDPDRYCYQTVHFCNFSGGGGGVRTPVPHPFGSAHAETISMIKRIAHA